MLWKLTNLLLHSMDCCRFKNETLSGLVEVRLFLLMKILEIF